MNPNNTQSKNTLRVVLEKKEDQHTNNVVFETLHHIINHHLSRVSSIAREY
jgi:hypothetical protein